MSSDEEVQRILLQGTLEHVDAQLDGTSTVIKLPISVVSCLDQNGRNALNARVSERVGKPTEIFLDSRTYYRVMIGSFEDIHRAWPCQPRETQDSMRVLHSTARYQPMPAVGDADVNMLEPDRAPRPKKKARGPANAFIMYRSHWAPIVKSEQPNVDNSSISKQLGDRWRALSAEDKAHWYQRAKEQKEEFLKQKEEQEKRKQERQRELNNRGTKRQRRNGSQTSTTPSEAPTPNLQPAPVRLQPLEQHYANDVPALVESQPPIFGGLPTPVEQPAAFNAVTYPVGGEEFNFNDLSVPVDEPFIFNGTAGLAQPSEDGYVPYYQEPMEGMVTGVAPATEVAAEEATLEPNSPVIDTSEEYLDWLNE